MIQVQTADLGREGLDGSGRLKKTDKKRSLLSVCLILAGAIHLLGLMAFGTYTLFKGTVPRMPFTSEGGVSTEDAGFEAPPIEEMLELAEDSSMDREATAVRSDAPELETDAILSTAAVSSSSLPMPSAPPAWRNLGQFQAPR